MAIPLIINGVTYSYPEPGDSNWGTGATETIEAIVTGMLQKQGGAFYILSEIDFGSSHGIKSTYYKSRSSDIADDGIIRLSNTDSIQFRNAANDGNLKLEVNSSNQLVFDNGVLSQPIQTQISVDDTSTINLTLSGALLTSDIQLGSIENAHINSSAAIAQSKLNLSITNSEVNDSASIARSKLATGSNNHVLINNGSGVMASESTLAKSRGGSGQDNTNLTFPATGTLATLSGSETLTNKTLDGDNNTVQDLGIGVLKTDVANANTVLAFDGSGVPTSTKVTPTYISSGLASNYEFLQADGFGNTNFQPITAATIDSETSTSGYVLTSDGTGGSSWQSQALAPSQPTIQIITSGSGTYTTPVGCVRLNVRMLGGGGGGGASGASSGTAATAGGDTTFGTSLLSAGGGGIGARDSEGGAGGTSSLGTGPSGIALTGGRGQGSARVGSSPVSSLFGGQGGSSAFGGSGGGGAAGGTGAGRSAAANTGGGGGGAYVGTTSNGASGSGGGSGGFVDAIIDSPASSYPYSVGIGGTGQASSGAGSFVGGDGGSGVIIVMEYY